MSNAPASAARPAGRPATGDDALPAAGAEPEAGAPVATGGSHEVTPDGQTDLSPGEHRARLRRARALGLQLPKPRLRGMIHLITFPTGILAGLLLVALGHDLAVRMACVVFVATAGLLFGISATYHRGTWRPEHALILRRFDHANIFLIIAGTYTPLAVALLGPDQAKVLLGISWGGALVGVAFRLFWTGAPRWLYVPAYVALGWVAIFYMGGFLATGGWAVVILLVAGGLAYTFGAVVYGVKRPNPSPTWFGFHEIFHACTVGGFGCHFAAVSLAVI